MPESDSTTNVSSNKVSNSQRRRRSWPIACKVSGCANQANLKKRRLCWKHYHQDKKGKIGQTREKEYHDMYGTPEYHTWSHFIQRCTNPKNKRYEDWGGRGIKVCNRYRHSFKEFYDDIGPRPNGMTLNRIDNDGNYSCGKCDDCATNGWVMNIDWATAPEQQVNKRTYACNTSGYKNISWSNRVHLWAIAIQRNGISIYTGWFDTLDDAVEVRDMVLEEYKRCKSLDKSVYADIGIGKRRQWAAMGGERNGEAKLTWEQVRRIRELWLKGGLYQTEISSMFGVNQTIVSKIVRNHSWKDDDYASKVVTRHKWQTKRTKEGFAA